MTTKLEKFSIIDARCDMSQVFKKWISSFGAKEVNLISTPASSSANNTSSSFNIQLADNTTCVIDRSSVELELPITIVMTGSASSGGNLYNPAYEGFRNRPVDRIMKKLEIRAAGGQSASYEPYLMTDAVECFTFDGVQRQTEPEQIDNCQSYADYNGTNASPFAGRFDNPYRVSRRAMTQITVNSNTYNSANLSTTLKMNMQEYPPFTDHVWHTGMNAQPLKLDISWVDYLARMWCRSPNHPQNTLTNMVITLGQPTLNMISLTLPFGQIVSDEQNFPYHQIDCQTCQTTGTITTGSTFAFDTGVQQLDFIPSRLYLFAKPSEGYVSTSLATQVNTPNLFTELIDASVNFANRSGIFNNYSTSQFFQMAKSNGLIPLYAYCDYVGENGGNNAYPLRGSIMAADVIKDVCNASKTITTGLSDKCNLQIKGHMKNISAGSLSYDIMLITVYDGIFSIINRNMGMSNLGIISSLSELKPLDIPYSQALAMMGGLDGGSAKTFFKGLWKGIKTILPVIKKSGVLGNIASMIPAIGQFAGPAVKSLGYGEGVVAGSFYGGEGEGIYAYGEGEGEGEGEGMIAGEGYRRKGKKKVYRTRKIRAIGEGGYLE